MANPPVPPRLPAGLAVRPMSLAELELVVDWAAREGWNPGLNDAAIFHATDPEGFLLATLEGEPVAAVSAVLYGDDFAFLGFYLVPEEHRGRGLSWAVSRAALERAEPRIMGLDGVVAQQANYRQAGFGEAFISRRHEGTGGGEAPSRARPLAEFPWPAVLALDRTCFPAAREGFLRAWVDQPGGCALGVGDGGELRGFAVSRPCRVGHKIGPLFARDPEAADLLYRGLAARLPGEPLFLDLPMPNRAGRELAARHELKPVFETARMYKNGRPELPLALVYGITSFELG